METRRDINFPKFPYEQETPKKAEKKKEMSGEITELFSETTLHSASDSFVDHIDEKRNVYVLKKSVDESAKEFFSKNETELVKFIQETGQKWIATVYKNKKGQEKFWFVKVVEDKDGILRIQRVAASPINKLVKKDSRSSKEATYANNKLIASGTENDAYAQKSYEFNPKKKQYEKVFKHVQRVKKVNSWKVKNPINSMSNINNKLISKNGSLPVCFPEITTHPEGYEIHEDAGRELFAWIFEDICPKGDAKMLRTMLDQHQNAVFKACFDSIIYFSEINYCYGDQKFENMCIKINPDGSAMVKIIDYGGGALLQENGQISGKLDEMENCFDPRTADFITKRDSDAPFSQQTRAVPVTAALIIDYIGLKYNANLIREETGFFDPVKIGNKIDCLFRMCWVTAKDQAILKFAIKIICLPAEQRPMPKQFKADYEAILAKFK